MWHLGRLVVVIFLLTVVVKDGLAQDRVVEVETNYVKSTVYADSIVLGPAIQRTFRVPVGTELLRLVPQSGDSWSIKPLDRNLNSDRSDTLRFVMNFPYYYKIESSPFGATVYRESLEGLDVLGETPLFLELSVPIREKLIVRRPGYLPYEIIPGSEVWNHHVFTMQPVQASDVQEAEIDWTPPKKRKRWIDYTAAVFTLATGAYAIYAKFEADRLYDEYQETGDPMLRPQIDTFDTRSAVALGAMQVGVGVLAFRFIFVYGKD